MGSDLERTQQEITLNLQEIDENFAKCNQIVTSRIMPQLERFAAATEEIRESTKVFPKSFIQFTKSFGRIFLKPPFSPQELLAARSNWKEFPKNTARDAPLSAGSLNANSNVRDMRLPYRNNNNRDEDIQSEISTPNSVNSKGALVDEDGNQIASPPRTTAFTPRSRSHALSVHGTPLRRAASILVDHDIERIREDLSESSEEEPRRLSTMEPIDFFTSGQGDALKRMRFNDFHINRRRNMWDIKKHEELQRLRRVAESPSNRQSRNTFSPDSDLVDTQTINKVLNERGRDLRHSRTQGSISVASEDRIIHGSIDGQLNSEDDGSGAYNFSENLPRRIIEDSPE
ncbi:hypothetical protein CU098_009456 [Rhizopus stolonifer]|uniref:DASH complex subunit ASK1 n=1 Tax=Rhizopus stolonifer TaxID=4846 RepID=A0A367JHQ1_RHIST|nr:hypothetical protein CU098_009456 [Rhizopus stolonifer]